MPGQSSSMSATEAHVRRRPDLWSYISFSRPPSRQSRSSSLPFRVGDNADPFEKPARRFSGAIPPKSNVKVKIRRYWKVGVVFGFILLVLFLLNPDRRARVRQYVGDYTGSAGGQRVSDPAAATSKCSKSYSPDRPVIQYALVIDAGSTGSRIHVYRFNNCGPSPELEDEEFVQTPKMEGGSGLSSYDADAEGAAKSLDILLDVALQKVPDSYKSCTPIAVKATAGLRKLGAEKAERILQAVRYRLETAYPFPLITPERGGVEVMDGKDEGVYAWITANYLLGKIGGSDQGHTAAVFDLGGGSTQIVFEPNFSMDPNAKLAEGDHKYDLSFGGRDFTLYQHSYLGYGLMAARENIHQLVVLGAYENSNPQDLSWILNGVVNPCIAPGQSHTVEVPMPEKHILGSVVKVEMKGPEAASAAQCRALAEMSLHKEAPCALAPCAFAGVHQPPLSHTFSHEDIYLFSYFYDRVTPLGMPESFTLNELKDLTSKVCGGESGWDAFHSVEGALEELKGRPEYCLDLNFMLALLHHGYGMDMNREVKVAKKIAGNELGWCLGASLPMLSKESGWDCKIHEMPT